MQLLFESIKDDIRHYCDAAGLSYDKLKRMVKGSGNEDLLFQYFDPTKDYNTGLLDETPMPVVLYIKRENGILTFEQTEHTKTHLM